MTRTALFKSNRTQAVRLPKAVAFPDTVREVEVRVEGNRRIICPVGTSWDDFFARPGIDIDEPPDLPWQERETF